MKERIWIGFIVGVEMFAGTEDFRKADCWVVGLGSLDFEVATILHNVGRWEWEWEIG